MINKKILMGVVAVFALLLLFWGCTSGRQQDGILPEDMLDESQDWQAELEQALKEIKEEERQEALEYREQKPVVWPEQEIPPAGAVAEWVIRGDTVSVDYYNSLAVKNDGSLWAWGRNQEGQNGVGRVQIHNEPVKVMDDVAAVWQGTYHSAAIRTDGTLWVWGDNTQGHVGNGEATEIEPYPVKSLDRAAFLGRQYWTAGAIDPEGGLWMWGNNTIGQVGDGTENNRLTPYKVMDHVVAVLEDTCSMAIQTNGTLWCWGTSWEVDDSPKRQSPKMFTGDVVWMDAGYWAICAIKSDQSLWVWGSDSGAKLGPVGMESARPVRIMEDVVLARISNAQMLILQTDHTLWGWGTQADGALGNGEEEGITREPVKILDDVRTVSVPSGMAIRTDDTLWAWGWNEYGQLGLGHTGEQLTPAYVTDNVHSVYQASSGNDYTLILKWDGTLWACGDNLYGQLGDGTYEIRTTPVQIMEDVRLPDEMPYWQQGVWPEDAE